MAIQTSSELQKLVLTSIVSDSNLFGNVIDDLRDSFFSDSSYQFIYKLLYRYYKQYSKSPSEQEILYLINENHSSIYGSLVDIVSEVESIYRSKSVNASFVLTSIETFIKRAKFEDLLADAAQKYESDKSFTIDALMDEFLSTYNYQVTDVDCMRLDDFDKYSKIREEVFGSSDNTKIIKSSIHTLNSKLTYRGYKPGDLITVVAAPGVGKTTFLINEGLAAAVQDNNNVLHIYLGDMNEITAANRYMACLTNMPINMFSLDPENYHSMILNDPRIKQLGVFSRLYNVSYPPSTISVDKLRVIIDKLQQKFNVHFDMILVDYADNLSQESDQMYQNGGEIYNKLKAIAVTNRCVIMTASQPQRAYYGSEIIPFEGIAESSKKLHIVDITLTIGKPMRSSNIATMHLAKVREGDTGDLIRLKLELVTSKITEIDETTYTSLKSEMFADPATKAVKSNSKDDD